MAITLNQNDIGYIQEYAGNLFALKEVNDDGSTMTGKNFFDLPDAEKVDYKSERKPKKVYNAKGDLKKSVYGERDVELKLTSLESNSNLLNWMLTETVGKYYAFIGWLGADDDATKQFVYCPIVQVEPSVAVSYPGRRPVITMTPLVPKVAWNAGSLTALTSSITGWNPSPVSLSASLSGTAYSEPTLFGTSN